MSIKEGRRFVPLVLALAAVAGACQSKPAAPPVSPDVWAVVDGREIRRGDVEKAYRRTAPPNPAISEDEATAAKLNVLDQLISEDIILARANELKIVLPESELEAAFNDQKKNMSDDVFNKALAARNVTAADLREALRRDLIAQKVIEREVTSKVTVTDPFVGFNLAQDTGTVWLDDITAHYPLTLAAWRERFLGAWERLRPSGYDERFRRLWDFYLSSSEAGFRERREGGLARQR